MNIIPKLSDLYTAALTALEAEFGVNVSPVGKAFLRAYAAAQAAVFKVYYLAIGGVQKNIFVDTADPESEGGTLERFGRVKLGRNPFAARAGQYVVTVTGTPGAVIAASTVFKSSRDALNANKLFILDQEYTLTAATDSITLRALAAGIGSQLEVGDTLTTTVPIVSVDSVVTVSAEAITPLAAEAIEAYRRAAIQAYQLEPQGGAASDYRIWSADAQGVETVYPYARSGAANEINLYVEAVTADSTDGKGTPPASMLTEVESVVESDPDSTKPINERGRRPLGVFQIHYLPVSPKDVTITIAGILATAAEQTAIRNALVELTTTIRPFVAGADVLADRNDTLDVNKIAAAILSVKPGGVFSISSLTVDSVATVSKLFTNGDIPYLAPGNVTFA